jgi:hypothetical protein
MAVYHLLVIKNETLLIPFLSCCATQNFYQYISLRFPLHVGPSVFAENTVTAVICSHMNEAFCFPQLDKTENPDVMFQQLLLRHVSATLCGRI